MRSCLALFSERRDTSSTATPRALIAATPPDYRAFLAQVTHSNADAAPTPLVDLVWHTHLQYPKRYRAECHTLASAFIDHDDDAHHHHHHHPAAGT